MLRWAFRILAVAAALTWLFGSGWLTVGMSHTSPVAWLIGPFFVVCAVGASILQFRVAFSHDAQAGFWLALILTPFGMFFLLLTAHVVIDVIESGRKLSFDYYMGLAIGPAICLVALVNAAWAWWHPTPLLLPNGPTAVIPRWRLSELLLAVTGFAVAYAGGVVESKNASVGHAAHASPEYAGLVLPKGASDVCVYRGWHDYLFYDFAIDEAGFWQWARGLGKSNSGAIRTAQPISGEFKILAGSDDAADLEFHTIRQGWYYDGQDERPEIQFAYDSDTGRAYFAGSERH